MAAWDTLDQKAEVQSTTLDLYVAAICRMIALHEKYDFGEWLGRVKVEKTGHLIEQQFGIDLGRRPIRDAAGPVDHKYLLQVIHQAEAERIFIEHSHEGGKRYSYSRLSGFEAALARSAALFGPKTDDIDRLIKLFVGMKADDTEIRATLFACWNDLLANGLKPSDEEIFADFYKWAPTKLRFSELDLRIAIADMRQDGLVPTGRSRETPSRSVKTGPYDDSAF